MTKRDARVMCHRIWKLLTKKEIYEGVAAGWVKHTAAWRAGFFGKNDCPACEYAQSMTSKKTLLGAMGLFCNSCPMMWATEKNWVDWACEKVMNSPFKKFREASLVGDIPKCIKYAKQILKIPWTRRPS